jgi:hypothetical protein
MPYLFALLLQLRTAYCYSKENARSYRVWVGAGMEAFIKYISWLVWS